MRKKLTRVLFVKCDSSLAKLVEQAAWLTGNNLSAFVRTAVLEKIQRMSVDYPQLKDRRGSRAA
jgi:hypothetical protein